MNHIDSTAGATAEDRTPAEDDGYDALRLRVSDPDLPWTDRDRAALDKLLREHARLTAALDRVREDAERLDWLESEEAREKVEINLSTYRAPLFRRNLPITRASIDAARTQPEGAMTETQPKVAPGDWVRFYKAGALVVGVVQYLRPDPFAPWKTQVSTDIGTVDVDAILECRSAASWPPAHL